MLDLLKGVRVVELTTIILGPMAGQILADFGAEVIKVEAPEGDLARYIDPLSPTGDSAMFVNNNRNKQSIALDLKTEEGREILHELVATADVFLHNMRLSAIERLGFGPAALRARHPRLIYCSAIGFGSAGPYASRPAYDDVIQAASGIAGLPTYMGQEPAYVPGVIADKIAALYAANSLAAALFWRERSGSGATIEVPMFEAADLVCDDRTPCRGKLLDDAAPGYRRLLNPHRRPFRTADGWLAVLPYTEAHWRRTFTELGRDDVLAQPWFADATERSRHTGEMYEALGQALSVRGTAEWLEVFRKLDVPHSRVSMLSDLLEDPHLQTTRFFEPTDALPGRRRSVPQPVSMDGPAKGGDRAAPELGADTRSLLAGLGYSESATQDLATRGVVRCGPATKEA